MEPPAARDLEGRVIGITADRKAAEQADLLERRGATVIHGPTLATEFLDPDQTLRAATEDVIAHPPDVFVATTGMGLKAWVEAARAWDLADALTAALAPAVFVPRGAKAATMGTSYGLTVWRKPEGERMDNVGALLLDELEGGAAGKRIALQEHGWPTEGLVRSLEAAGASVLSVPVYRWRIPDDTSAAQHLIAEACAGRVDAITFTSAPAVGNLLAIAGLTGRAAELREGFAAGRPLACCVGPVCADAARDEGIERMVYPEVGRLGLMVRALVAGLA